MTACGPMMLPAPMTASAPTIEYGPTSTSAASSADGSTIAVEWIFGIPLRLENRHEQRRRGGDLIVDERAHDEAPPAVGSRLPLRFEHQLVAGHDLAPEAAVLDAVEIHAR